MRTWLDDLGKWLDSPAGSIVAVGLPILVRALWPRLSKAARKRVPPRRKKGAKHENKRVPTPAADTVEPGVGL